MVIARPSAATFTPVPPLPLRMREDPEGPEPLFGQAFEEGVAKLDAILKARLKAAKKRTVPNARELVASYNRRSQHEEILDINDPEQVEWIDLGPDKPYATGDEVTSFSICLMQALKVPEDPKMARHYWPIRNGVFNEVEYLSRQELIGDVQLILEDAIKTEMDINTTDYKNYNVVLLIHDLFDKTFIYEMTRLLFQDMGFAKVAFLQVDPYPSFVDVGIGCSDIWCRNVECLRR